ncbi:MAG: glycosyltransferase family 4 protein [Caldilineaceae bacterium]|nr:glycosyltransferase family 4 protein [Caldilineaceae bacterium]
MHIALNAQLLSTESTYRGAGVSNYSRHLLAALGELAQSGATDHRFTAFVHTRDFAAPGVTLRAGPAWLERPAARILWEQTALPCALAGADVVHGLVNVLPLATATPGVVTVHDLSFLRLPDHFPPLKRAYLAALCRWSVGRAAQVIAVGPQTAADLAHFLGVEAARLHTIPNGVDARFAPADAAHVAAFRQTKGLPARYWLYLGTLEPRKNLPLLLDAFARSRQSGEDAALHLVLAGGRGWGDAAIFDRVAALGLHDVVHLPGFVPDAELPDWYRAAEGFAYPSRFEGFGLPVLEAMACGTPVVCSAAPGVREVAGRAALQAPPDDVEAWAAALTLLAGQPALRAALRQAGLDRARCFTWRAAAEQTLAVYERAVGSRQWGG